MTDIKNIQMENDKESMLDALESVQEVKVGDIVQGEVLALEEKQVIVSILGTGVEGVVPANELTAFQVEDISTIVTVGDILDLVVITTIGKDKENGSYLLSKKRLDAKKIWEKIEADYQAGTPVEGPVTEVVKGGLVVDLGVRGFVPASMISDQFVSDFSDYNGQTLRFKIMEIEPSENRLILSRKAIVQDEKAIKRQAVLDKLVAGDILTGKVARITDFGAFVDLGGIDGLVHVSEISHSHVSRPSDVLTVGDMVEVKVLGVDYDKKRISLSIKETQTGPWEGIQTKISEGDVLTGVVKRLTSFGAFVEVAEGIEGLVHISQISHKHVVTPHEVLQEGQEAQVKVLELNPAERRIALSIKALEEQPTTEKEVVTEDYYEMPEEVTGFSLGDILGNALEKSKED